jgi:hypothetical protein
MKLTIKHAMLSMIIFIFTAGSALAADTLKYTGEIADDAGNPLNGEYLMTFSLYDDPQGYIIWEETQEVVVQDGHYEVVLGSNNPLSLPEDKEYYLEITLGGSPELAAQDVVTPAGKKPKKFKKPVQIKDWLLVGSTSYTPNGKLEVNPNGIEDDGDEFVVDNDGNVGIGTTSPGAKLDVSGSIKFGGRVTQRITKCFSTSSSGNANNRYHKWVSSECSNGLPQGDCIGFISKAQHNGDDEDWQVMNPGESYRGESFPNGGMYWWMDSFSGNPRIEAVYFCDQ